MKRLVIRQSKLGNITSFTTDFQFKLKNINSCCEFLKTGLRFMVGASNLFK